MQTHLHSSPPARLLSWLMVLLFTGIAAPALADELDKDENFTVTQYKDHLHFKLMIMDGKNKDTWCRVGSIHAYSGPNKTGTHIHLMDVECDQGEDDSTDKEIFSRNVHEGTRAFLTNTPTGVEKLIDFASWDQWGNGYDDNVRKNRPTEVRYTIKKSSSELRPSVEIDYYWSADMAGQKWYLYYEFQHNAGSIKNRTIGEATCREDMGYGTMDRNDYTYRRDGGDQILFTLPALPTDIPGKLNGFIRHYGEYELTFYYTKQDGTVVTQSEYLSCDTNGEKKEVRLPIPKEAGNFKQVDMDMTIHWGLAWYNGKVKGKTTQGARKKNIFTSVPVPFGLAAEYNQYESKAALSWNAFATGDNNYIKETVPYIYRVETDKNGKPVSGASWQNRGKNAAIGDSQEQGYTDNMLSDNAYYQYMVVNVPKDWIDGKMISSQDLNDPGDELLNRLGYCVSDVMSTIPSLEITNLAQDTAVTDNVRLTWEYSRVPVKSSNVRFEVMKRQKGTQEWQSYGNVSAPANPTAGYVASFTDNKLPSVRETFEYKIVLSINDGKNTFESDIITAGLLKGSAVLSVDATKGTHENVVRVSWNVKQVGTANSNFEVFRRYAGTTDEFLKVYSVSGTSDSYTYEDNTVQSGYFYEYRVDVYSGDKESYTDNNFQNFLSDVGFCQARGVISGRVTFGTGSAVEDVRMSLRSNADADGNVVRGFSQRVDGASTGIVWDADSAATMKVFGTDKDYTVQMFVRPDNDMAEGAVLGEIPSLGRLRLGSKTDEGYTLLVERYGDATTERGTFTSVKHIRGVIVNVNQTTGYDDTSTYNLGHVYSYQEFLPTRRQWEAEGYDVVRIQLPIVINMAVPIHMFLGVKTEILDINATIDKTSWKGTWYDTQLKVKENTYSLLTLQSINNELTLSVGDSISTTLTEVSSKDYQTGSDNLADYPNTHLYQGDYTLLYTLEADPGFNFERWKNWWKDAFTPGNGEYSTVTRPVVKPFSVGGSKGIGDDEAFEGNLTEVRVWNHALTDKEKKNTTDRVLTGSEKGLSLYWPMDEGISRFVFDASYSNDLPNGRHADVGNNITCSTIVPTDAQLSRYGLTNENGEYTVRGLPFIGSGTTYNVTPSKGIHIFSPTSRNGFIGTGSLALNNYDFTDQSSFPVRGRITYLNTDIPVDSIQFKIDGQMVQGTSNKMIMTDGNGDYEISVPIGPHLIECFKEGHRLTSFPLDGSTYDFKQEMTVNFTDSTLVNVTGRINGGFSDQNEPVGFALSENRLGKATLKLSLGKESHCSFNYVTDEHGSGSYGKTPIPVASATDKIQSTSYRAAATERDDETFYIYITTDPKTGEYSALLPPLNYKLESITFEGGKDYDDKPVFAQNLPFIDATNTNQKTWRSDSLKHDGVVEIYPYAVKMNRQYRANPIITFEQMGMKNGAFGEVKVPVISYTPTTDSVTVVTFTDKGFKYEYDYPIFYQENDYEYEISVAEHYKNLDTGEEFDEVPSDAIISIDNSACASVMFACEEGYINGEKVTPGMLYDVPNVRIRPKKDGHATYSFKGGIPNLGESHLRSISVGVSIDNRMTMWTNPATSQPGLDLILLGSLSSGNQNFVTNGPEHVDMVLRRPPGSTSEAVLTTDTIRSTIKQEAHLVDSNRTGGGFYVSVVPEITSASGAVGFYVETKFAPQVNTENVWDSGDAKIDESDKGSVYTLSTEIRGTTEGIQYKGDTYIGRSTNMLFGKGNTLGFFKQKDGSYKIDTHESIVMSQQFGTYFAYPQEYIEETLIPNWKAIIKARLTEGHVEADHWDKNKMSKVPGKVMYYTIYSAGDPEFGRSNGDDKWGNLRAERGGHPSYMMVNGTDEPVDDEVDNAIRQIKAWEAAIADNEEDKLKAFKDNQYFIQNYSIAGGTSVSQKTKVEGVNTSRVGTQHEWNFDSETHLGLLFSGAGGYAIIRSVQHSEDKDVTETTNNTAKEVAWTISDADPRTALSVDVFNSPRQWGPIFRTRGGQTANPHEEATYTKYYLGGGEQLDEGTMRVEWPQLTVKGSSKLTNVPTGGQAAFNLEMTNLSETNSDCTYILEAIEKSNAKGAILEIDGAPLSLGKAGRAISIKGNKESVNKMLYVRQSDRSVNHFEDLQLVLRSEKDESTTSDTLHLSVEFVPASAIIDMAVAHTVLNQTDLGLYKGFQVKFSNLDRQDKGLQGLRIQYRRKGTDSWSLAHQWLVDESALGQGDEVLPPSDDLLLHSVSFPNDGIYELRGQTFGKYGNDDVTYETPIIEVIQDTRGPKILGMASHEGQTLYYSSRDDMHVRFNEVLNGNAMSEAFNFVIEGDLNNVADKSQFADVALQLNGDELSTDASYSLSENDLTLGLWLYRQTDGNIFSMGSASNKLVLYTYDGGQLAVRTGEAESVIKTGVVMPQDQWTYLALNYKRKTDSDPENRVTLLYSNANSNSPVYAAENEAAGDLNGEGNLSVGGKGMKGMMYDLTLWKGDKSAAELYETREEQKAAYTPGLIGYWRMDEGHGTLIRDGVRSRHINLPVESWYINNRNLAAHLDGESPLKVDISSANTRVTDNFAVEMWFRGEQDKNDNAQLVSVLNGMSIGFKDGGLVLEKSTRSVDNNNIETKTVHESIVLSDVNYCDNNWHHIALNVRRGTSAVVYIDGQAVKTIPENSIPAITGHYLFVGGEETLVAPDGSGVGGATNLFIGDVDELRIWNASIGSYILADRRYERLDNSYAGLVGYFPMEEINRLKTGDIESVPSMANFGDNKLQMKLEGNLVTSQNAPAILPGSSRIRLDDNDFSFTVSADEIYFHFQETMYPLMDGNEFAVTVKNIKDEYNNLSEPVMWKFSCDFATIDWLSGDMDITKEVDETFVFTESVYNMAGSGSQHYEISGLPSWMTIDKAIGTMNSTMMDFKLTVLPSAPIGHHTVYLTLTDKQGIKRMKAVNVTVTGDVPDWAVNEKLYESNMQVTGQIYIGDKICEYTDSKIAAFDENGNCRGTGSPRYVETRDAYYVDMIIYGGAASELSSAVRDLSFKYYDASTGRTYPLVSLDLTGNNELEMYLPYSPDAVYGSYDSPIRFLASDVLEQGLTLEKGWSWISFYVKPLFSSLENALPTNLSDRSKLMNVKGHKEFATYNKSTKTMTGQLVEFVPGKMYKVQTSAKLVWPFYGTIIDVRETSQTIYEGYNWIGTLSSKVMSPADAFAGLNPQKGDMVKNRTTSATYNGQGVWEGTLKSIVPGQGYIYLSKDSQEKTFHYPTLSDNNSAQAASFNMGYDEPTWQPGFFSPVDEHQFPDNMNMIAVVKKDGRQIEDAEVAAFVNGECRGAVSFFEGYYFLSILGSSADDLNNDIEIRVYVDGEEYTWVDSQRFISDAVVGTLEEPYVLDVDVTAIRTIVAEEAEDDTEWYTLQGQKLDRRPTQQGVYIHKGEKVVVKRSLTPIPSPRGEGRR